MKLTEDIKKFIRETDIKTNAGTDNRVLGDIMNVWDAYKNTAKFKTNIWRIIMKSSITKLAAAAVIIIAVIIVSQFNVLSTPAFARVIEKVTNAQSVKFLLKQKIGPQPVLLSKMYIQGRRIRIDIVGAESMQQGAEQLQKEMERRNLTALFSQIGDFAAKEVLELDHFNKTYVRKALNEQVVAEFTKSNLIEQFRNIKYQDAQKLREETQDGRKIDVYLVKHVELMGMREDLSGQEGERMTVWIDRQSSLPIRILLEASTEVNGQSKDWFDFSEFSWNEPIGEDILSLQAPENYQAAKPQDITGKSD